MKLMRREWAVTSIYTNLRNKDIIWSDEIKYLLIKFFNLRPEGSPKDSKKGDRILPFKFFPESPLSLFKHLNFFLRKSFLFQRHWRKNTLLLSLFCSRIYYFNFGSHFRFQFLHFVDTLVCIFDHPYRAPCLESKRSFKSG